MVQSWGTSRVRQAESSKVGALSAGRVAAMEAPAVVEGKVAVLALRIGGPGGGGGFVLVLGGGGGGQHGSGGYAGDALQCFTAGKGILVCHGNPLGAPPDLEAGARYVKRARRIIAPGPARRGGG